MQARVWFRCDPRPVERIEADLALCGLFEDSAPLRGGVGRFDWRLCGQLSALRADCPAALNRGQCSLVAAQGRIAAPRLLVVGLGAAADYDAEACAKALATAFERALELAAKRLVLAPLGYAAADTPRHVPAIVAAAVDAATRRPLEVAMAVQLPVPRDEISRVERALELNCRAGDSAVVRVEQPRSAVAPAASRAPTANS